MLKATAWKTLYCVYFRLTIDIVICWFNREVHGVISYSSFTITCAPNTECQCDTVSVLLIPVARPTASHTCMINSVCDEMVFYILVQCCVTDENYQIVKVKVQDWISRVNSMPPQVIQINYWYGHWIKIKKRHKKSIVGTKEFSFELERHPQLIHSGFPLSHTPSSIKSVLVFKVIY